MRDDISNITALYQKYQFSKTYGEIMASSSTRTDGPAVDYFKQKYGLDSMRIDHMPPGVDGLTIHVRKGTMGAMYTIPAVELHSANFNITGEIDQRMAQFMQQLTNRLDLRYNNIEDMNDFLTLVSRQQEKNPGVDTVILTPQQVQTLIVKTMTAEGRPDLIGQPIMTLYGYKVDTQEQD